MSRLLPLILATVLCSGCAYNNAIKRGDQQFSDGNYEHAVAAYQQALVKKPNAEKAHQKLAIAQQNLDIWATRISSAASSADSNGLSALAAVLYQKQSQLKNDNRAANRAADLRREISTTYTPTVFADGPSELLTGLSLPSRRDYRPKTPNHLLVQVSTSSPQFTSESFDATGNHEYISGIITRSNPRYLELEHDLQELDRRIEALRDEAHYQHTDIEREERHLATLEGALGEQQHLLETADPESPTRETIEERIAELEQSRQHSKKKLKALHREYDDTRHDMDNDEEDFNHLVHRLEGTPEEIEEDVYATYTYPLTEVVQTATLTLNFIQGVQRQTAEVSYSYNDQVYDGSARVGLEPNPREPISKADLRLHLQDRARQRVAEHLTDTAEEYRQQLWQRAMQQADQRDKLDQLIRYTLSGAEPDADTRQLTNQLLRAEYGSGGTLDIYQLLKF